MLLDKNKFICERAVSILKKLGYVDIEKEAISARIFVFLMSGKSGASCLSEGLRFGKRIGIKA